MKDRSKRRTLSRKTALVAATAALPAMAMVMMTGGSAAAHGAPMDPGSRTYLCYVHSIDHTGQITPSNPACAAALAQGGHNAYYNWFAVLQSNGQGRTAGFIPDGQLCSGASGAFDFSGFDLPRDDWPYTHVTAGDDYRFSYNVWAHHPGSFHMYVTKDGFDPSQPLTWDDMEDEPFASVDDPPWTGVGSIEDEYYWTSTLPDDKEGRHIIYTVWERSDSPETFYSCSDVVFDGGNGEVTVPGGSTGASAEVAEAHSAVPDLGDHDHHGSHASHGGATHASHSAPVNSTADWFGPGNALSQAGQTVGALLGAWSGR
ncbi:lytic polysaccharide monooxygenase auxiliary activity family 9 protein [Streptomyces lonarensis]|uniref:Lytic polysaccharide monooxygenase n=1 Tax=Streptomyces lonarensis TaxID=700599 RepID=A0A7X6HZG6_9ACTN|nr:lytic polysaccharide monooxygenase [Streptomyces lonarensis]NJQ06628.1 lytic polysaccharide monooxygenase [Streptomyces lonarensis]